ncbi:pre-rRNA-processing protein PNO1, putative [Entamoeba dispar SAW760]|uniref:Pre-rRNA-processing protein PNO1, putative n=1 Tax=Entamoeba dispar (strain ATCC PRA-260 / SAW760) TaxID=370354 RepID=B0EMV2_ENTDS|nr:pre-rRNA-processing protein PNO1, putative [Entamoeba dispar SAW760]EDR24076.1 pre-rRNA-processing protein PNO1, putative [Entamoeba dispar SAW760]|eukprot:EDR24076.1 pre-rRNA-processing protein PNO1, putative [Entamoeba dispar SAW760]
MAAKPEFQEIKQQQIHNEDELREIHVPGQRFNYVKENWIGIYQPIVSQLKLNIRMNPSKKIIQLKTNDKSQLDSLQRASDFINAIGKGFEVKDAIALLRMDDIFVDSFEIEDVKKLHGDHLNRAIGRIAGKDGKTKFSIENTTHTRIVMQYKKIHIMGSYANIKIARDAIQDLILGAPPGKVYNNLRTIASRMDSAL